MDYGVRLDPTTLELDKAATEKLRRRRLSTLPLFDRGPTFVEAEAQRYAQRRCSRWL